MAEYLGSEHEPVNQMPHPSAPLMRAGGLLMPPGVRYGFTTREGGVGSGPRGTLSLARAAGYDDDLLVENWRRALRGLDPALEVETVAVVNQVHGAEVRVVEDGAGPLAPVGDADALVTTARGVVLAVRVADCVPLLLASPRGVAAVHAGWRGVAARIAVRALDVLLEETGDRADEVVAVVGPHIHQDAFEVGPEVVAGIAASGVAEALFAERRGDRFHVDLGAALDAQLRARGVPRIGRAGGCTTGPRFYSWRADGPETGRQAGLIVRGR